LAFLLFSSWLNAQIGVGSINGELHVTRGDFPGTVLVELQLRGATITSQYCDEEGKFGFQGLNSNPYHIVIHDERYNPVEQLVVLDTSISGIAMAIITLTPREAAKPESKNPQQGSNPYLMDPSEYRHHFPKSAVKEFDAGVRAEKNHQQDEALRHYEKAILLAPNFYPARNNLGAAYLNQSDYPAAQAQFEQVIKINPSDGAAYFNLGNLYLLTRKYDDAGQWLQRGLGKEPGSSLGHFLLGSVYTRIGKQDLAEKELNSSLQLDPKATKPRLALVNLYLQQGHSTEAIQQLKEFLQSALPDDPFVPKAKQILQKLEAQSADAQKR
jgi:tetratricopeptide (TPR) repeat protein